MNSPLPRPTAVSRVSCLGSTSRHRLAAVRRVLGCGLALLAEAGSLSCAPRSPTTPEATLGDYAHAIEDQRWDQAYALLSEETRAVVSFEDFKDQMTGHPREAAALASRIKTAIDPPAVTATVQTRSGDQLLLVYQDGGWKIDESAIDFYSQREPRVAIGSFLRAFDYKRYDVLLRFVPRDKLDEMTVESLRASFEGELRDEMESMIEGIRASYTTARIEVLGEHAAMSYGNDATVELILENGAWKIEDIK